MNEVIVNSTSQMSDADLRAMAVYLKSLAAVDIGGGGVAWPCARRRRDAVHDSLRHLPFADRSGSTPGQDLGPPLAGSAVAA
jgi:hypothetical protein